MPTDTVTYTETDESAGYSRRFTPEHLKELAMAQAQENAQDPEHIAKVNDIVARARAGERRPVDLDSLQRGAR